MSEQNADDGINLDSEIQQEIDAFDQAVIDQKVVNDEANSGREAELIQNEAEFQQELEIASQDLNANEHDIMGQGIVELT